MPFNMPMRNPAQGNIPPELLNRTTLPNPRFNPALLMVLALDPEKGADLLAAQGIPPPSFNTNGTVVSPGQIQQARGVSTSAEPGPGGAFGPMTGALSGSAGVVAPVPPAPRSAIPGLAPSPEPGMYPPRSTIPGTEGPGGGLGALLDMLNLDPNAAVNPPGAVPAPSPVPTPPSAPSPIAEILAEMGGGAQMGGVSPPARNDVGIGAAQPVAAAPAGVDIGALLSGVQIPPSPENPRMPAPGAPQPSGLPGGNLNALFEALLAATSPQRAPRVQLSQLLRSR